MKKRIVTFALAVTLFSACFSVQGQETKVETKKNPPDPAKQMVEQFLKQLEKAEVSEEQKTKIKELMKKAFDDVVKQRMDAQITQKMLKKRAEAAKQAREEGKKPNEVKEIVDKSVELTDEQRRVLRDNDVLLKKARVEVGKILKADQIAKLPKQFAASLEEKKK